MKLYISRPPVKGESTEKQLEALTSWLFALSNTLNAAFESIGVENLNSELKSILSERNR